MTTFKVARNDRAANKVKVGQLVYECVKPDYGLSSDDTRESGVYHISVTLDPDGGYPFFTIPLEDLE